MDRTPTAALNFGINFLVGYLGGRFLRDERTGIVVGVVLGGLGAVASLRLADQLDPGAVESTSEPVEIEIEG